MCVLSASDLSNFTFKITQDTLPSLDDRKIAGDERFSAILDTIIGTTITILDVFNAASDAIPVPLIKPLVAIVAGLLKAIQVSLWNLVPLVLPANDC